MSDVGLFEKSVSTPHFRRIPRNVYQSRSCTLTATRPYACSRVSTPPHPVNFPPPRNKRTDANKKGNPDNRKKIDAIPKFPKYSSIMFTGILNWERSRRDVLGSSGEAGPPIQIHIGGPQSKAENTGAKREGALVRRTWIFSSLTQNAFAIRNSVHESRPSRLNTRP